VYEVTVEDPRYLTRPVEFTGQWEYRPDLRASGVECDLEVARRYLAEADVATEPPASAGVSSRWPTILGTSALIFVVGRFLVFKTRRGRRT
jgi:hypothetical protein